MLQKRNWPIHAGLGLCLSLIVGRLELRAEDPFAATIRPTEARTPEEERKGFHLPPGFEIQLFAAEPEIQKPINMAFDSRGRLWVSGSTEYPFPAPLDRKGRDSIRILEDTNGDGKADKVTVFADGLNVPIGLYPFKNGCIAYSVPNIYWLEDTDGDGKADKREVLYGPFDYGRDTHGMQNAFRRGFDGWIYADHGFANHSSVRGKDGHLVEMQSGNTYRFKPDGSRIEQFTWGQVNPFGLTFNSVGELYSADCHTKPIMLLLRRGYYDSFGKPHDGLGYVPGVMQHDHGSTAIAGSACYESTQFPAEFRGDMFCGNVMTSRVNRDAIQRIGGTVKAIEKPDFVISDDPWFRPVDIQIGPDGALYIADFYNKIIGHYEVPLTHPGRDRHRGRIWRVTYVGTKDRPGKLDSKIDLRSQNPGAVIAAFEHPNLGVRMRAGDEIVDRIGSPAIGELRKSLSSKIAVVRTQAMWGLYRLQALESTELQRLANDPDRLVRCHAMKALAESANWSNEMTSLLVDKLNDPDALVVRMATDAMGQHPESPFGAALLGLWDRTLAEDVHLRHAIKLALLEVAKRPGSLTKIANEDSKPAHAELLAQIALAIDGRESGEFMLAYLKKTSPPTDVLAKLLLHAAKHVPNVADVEALAGIAQRGVANNIDLQLDLLLAIKEGLVQRGLKEPPAIRDWGATLAKRLLDSIDPGSLSWTSWTPDHQPAAPWKLQKRNSADGKSNRFLSSFPLGESYTGVLQSKVFKIPGELRFYVCGQHGEPEKPADNRNRVRLRLADSNEVIADAISPRNDVAQQVRWTLTKHAGKRGYIEVVDGCDLPSWAWIAVGRFEPPVVAIPESGPDVAAKRMRSAAQIAETLKLRDLSDRLHQIVGEECADVDARAAAARACEAIAPTTLGSAFVEVIGDRAVSPTARNEAAVAIFGTDSKSTIETLGRLARAVPYRLQTAIAERLAESKSAGVTLLDLVDAGSISARVLQAQTIRNKLLSTNPPDVAARIQKLTASLSPIEAEIQKLIQSRRSKFNKVKGSAERGQAVFVKNCGTCHQIAGKGVVVGPQLDGIGGRGIERILEDTLDPNRNVDPQFFATLFTLTDGRVVTGLLRRQQGKSVVYVDQAGKEVTLASDQIEQQTKSHYSPMPANWGTAMSETDFYDLLAYLLSQRAEPVKPLK